MQLYHHTRNCTLARALTSDHDAPRGAPQRDGHTHLSFIYALPQERRFTDDDARPTASPRARTHVAPTHPASDAVSGRPLLWTRHTGTRRGGGAPTAAVPTAAVLTAAVPTAAKPPRRRRSAGVCHAVGIPSGTRPLGDKLLRDRKLLVLIALILARNDDVRL